MWQPPFNAIALLLLATLSPVLGLSCSRVSQPFRSDNVKASEKYRATLSSFQTLQGTSYLMAAVNDGTWSRSDKLLSSGSYGGGGQTRNLVFLDAGSLTSRRLFETNAYVILQTDEYTRKVEGKAVTQWLVHQVLKADTDGDQQLTRDDLQTIGVSAASGQNYTEVLTGLTEIFGLTMVTPGKLVVVYRKDGTKSASIVDLEQRQVLSTQPVVDLGPEVK